MEAAKSELNNRFFAGMHKDNDYSMRPENTYDDALNFRLTNVSGSSYILEEVDGNIVSFSITSGYTSIGYGVIKNKLIIFSTDGTNGQVGLLSINRITGIGSSYTVLYSDVSNPSNDKFNFDLANRIEAYGIPIDSITENVYWWDNLNQPRVINILDPSLSSRTVAYFGYQIKTFLGEITLDSVITGSVEGGSVSYFYRLRTKSGYATPIALMTAVYPVTNNIPVPGGTAPNFGKDNYQNINGVSSNESSSIGFKIKITNVSQVFDYIDVGVIHYSAFNTADYIGYFDSKNITGTTMYFDHTSDNNSLLETLTEIDLNVGVLYIEKNKTGGYAKSRGVLSNISLGDNERIKEFETIVKAAVVTGYPNGIYWKWDVLSVLTDEYPGSSVARGDNILPYLGHSPRASQSIPIPKYNGLNKNIEITNDYVDDKGVKVGGELKSFFRSPVVYSNPNNSYKQWYSFGIQLYDVIGSPIGVIHIADIPAPGEDDTWDGSAVVSSTKFNLFTDNADGLYLNHLFIRFYGIPFDVLTTAPAVVSAFSIVMCPVEKTVLAHGLIQPVIWANEFGLDEYRPSAFVPLLDNIQGSVIDAPTYPASVVSPFDPLYAIQAPEFQFQNPEPIVTSANDKIITGKCYWPKAISNAQGALSTPKNEDTYYHDLIFPDNINGVGNEGSYFARIGDKTVGQFGTGTMEKLWGDLKETTSLVKNVLETLSVETPYGAWLLSHDKFSYFNGKPFVPLNFTLIQSNLTYIRGWLSTKLLLLKLNERVRTDASIADLTDNVNPATPTSPKTFAPDGIAAISKLQAYYIRPNGSPYGGTSASALANREYIGTGHYQLLDNATYVANGNSWKFDNVGVIGGDCYLQVFGFVRMTPVSSIAATAYERIGTITAYVCQSRINALMRQGYFGLKNDLAVNTFPTNAISDVNPEQYIYNTAYSSTQNSIKYAAFDSNKNYQSNLPYRNYYTDKKFLGQTLDLFRIFPVNNLMDLDPRFGEIVNIRSKGNKIFYWQEDSFGYLPIEEKILSGQDQAQVVLGIGGALQRYDGIEEVHGNQQQWGLIETENGFVWLDVKRRQILAASNNEGGLVQLSLIEGIESYLKTDNRFVVELIGDNTHAKEEKPLLNIGINGGFDPKYKTAYITVLQSEYGGQNFTIRVNVLANCTEGFDSRLPGIWFNVKNDIFISNKADDNRVFAENYGPICNFYGDQYNSNLTVIISPRSQEVLFDNMEMLIKDFGVQGIYAENPGYFFDLLEYSNTFQSVSEYLTRMDRRTYRFYNRKWHWSVPTEARRRLVDYFLKVKFSKLHTQEVTPPKRIQLVNLKTGIRQLI